MAYPWAIDVIGLMGVSLVLLAYLLLQTRVLTIDALYYSVLNCMGAVLIFISLLFNWNLASVVIEVVWFSISIFGIYKFYTRK